MSRLPKLQRSRRARLAGWLVGALAMAAAAICVTPEANAADRLDASAKLTSLSRTSFGTPRLTWSTPPLVYLQPQRARVMLNLPAEWMPAPTIGFLGARGISLVPQKHWHFHTEGVTTQATIGPSVMLRVQDPRRSIDFGLRVMPRSAVAVLRFDPVGRLR